MSVHDSLVGLGVGKVKSKQNNVLIEEASIHKSAKTPGGNVFVTCE